MGSELFLDTQHRVLSWGPAASVLWVLLVCGSEYAGLLSHLAALLYHEGNICVCISFKGETVHS